jgi:hypothetical protein
MMTAIGAKANWGIFGIGIGLTDINLSGDLFPCRKLGKWAGVNRKQSWCSATRIEQQAKRQPRTMEQNWTVELRRAPIAVRNESSS